MWGESPTTVSLLPFKFDLECAKKVYEKQARFKLDGVCEGEQISLWRYKENKQLWD
jgi:hypothetical protein